MSDLFKDSFSFKLGQDCLKANLIFYKKVIKWLFLTDLNLN